MGNKTDHRNYKNDGTGVDNTIERVGGTNNHADNWTLWIDATDYDDKIKIRAKPVQADDANLFDPKNNADMLERVFIDLGGGNDYYDSSQIKGTWATNDFEEFINGGGGNDEIHTAQLDHLSGAKVYGGRGSDRIYTDRGDDFVYGDSRISWWGGPNNYSVKLEDELSGLFEYNDFISTGNGRDTIYGEYGNDIIFAGDGNDFIDGGSGNDIIFGGDGGDKIYGGEGNDFIDVGRRHQALDEVWTGDGHDIVNLGTMVAAYGSDGTPLDIDYEKIVLDGVQYAATLTAKTFVKELAKDGEPVGLYSTLAATGVKSIIAIVRAVTDHTVPPVVLSKQDYATVHDFSFLDDRAVFTTVPSQQGALGELHPYVDYTNHEVVLSTDETSTDDGGVIGILQFDDKSITALQDAEYKYAGFSADELTLRDLVADTIVSSAVTITRDNNTFEINNTALSDEILNGTSPNPDYDTLGDYLKSLLADGQTAYFFGGARTVLGEQVGEINGNIHVLGSDESDILYATSRKAEQGDGGGTTATALLFGYDGDDVLVGSKGDDFLIGGRGQDLLVGGKGFAVWVKDDTGEHWDYEIDTFVFDGENQTDVGDAARDTIVGFDLDHDVIRLTGYGNITASDLWFDHNTTAWTGWEHADYKNNSSMVDIVLHIKTDNGDVKDIVFQDIMAADATAADRQAAQAKILAAIEVLTSVGSDGIGYWDALFPSSGTALLYGSDGDDVLIGSNGNDFLSGGRGQDLLVGGGASTGTGPTHQNQTDIDTFVFNGENQKDVGDAARDTIVGFDLDHDVIRLTGYGDITASDLWFDHNTTAWTGWEHPDYENDSSLVDIVLHIKTDNGDVKDIVFQDILPADATAADRQAAQAKILASIEVLTSVDSDGIGHWDALFPSSGDETTGADPTDTDGTDPTDPPVTDPTDPPVTDPTDTDPKKGSGKGTTDPVTDPVLTDPTDPNDGSGKGTTDPVTDPVMTDPNGNGKGTADPITDPVMTDPNGNGKGTTDPVTDPTDTFSDGRGSANDDIDDLLEDIDLSDPGALLDPTVTSYNDDQTAFVAKINNNFDIHSLLL